MMRTSILELCILSALQVYSVLAHPHPSPREILPRNVLDVIPGCGQSCLWDFIISSYPADITCDLQNDLGCLCRANTTTGLTLSEGAIQCIWQFCPEASNLTGDASSICSGQQGALPNTHSILILPSATAVNSRESQSTAAPLSTSTTISADIVGTGEAPASTRATISGSPLVIPPTAVTLTSTPAQQQQVVHGNSTAAAATEPQRSLTKVQIIGISAGSAAVAGFGLAIVLLVRCVRHRDRLKRRTAPIVFKISRPIVNEPDDWQDARSFDSGATATGDEVALHKVGGHPGIKEEGFSADSSSGSFRVVDIGIALSLAVSPEPESDGRRARTMSRLLPERPEAVRLRPAASPATQKQVIDRNERPFSSITLFEDVD